MPQELQSGKAPSLIPQDGGVLYTETDLSRPVVEPWNAVSSLAILLPAIYWAYRLRHSYKQNPFMAICLPLLFLGGLGSTLYHAFRSDRIWLMLDITPTIILTLLLALFFWAKVLPRKWMAIPILLLVLLVRVSIRYYIHSHLAINISYAISGIAFFVPLLIFLARSRWQGVKAIGLSIFFLVLSLVFRQLDQVSGDYLPMGTHFLWHIFSGVGAYYLGLYLYQLQHWQKSEAVV